MKTACSSIMQLFKYTYLGVFLSTSLATISAVTSNSEQPIRRLLPKKQILASANSERSNSNLNSGNVNLQLKENKWNPSGPLENRKQYPRPKNREISSDSDETNKGADDSFQKRFGLFNFNTIPSIATNDENDVNNNEESSNLNSFEIDDSEHSDDMKSVPKEEHEANVGTDAVQRAQLQTSENKSEGAPFETNSDSVASVSPVRANKVNFSFNSAFDGEGFLLERGEYTVTIKNRFSPNNFDTEVIFGITPVDSHPSSTNKAVKKIKMLCRTGVAQPSSGNAQTESECKSGTSSNIEANAPDRLTQVEESAPNALTELASINIIVDKITEELININNLIADHIDESPSTIKLTLGDIGSRITKILAFILTGLDTSELSEIELQNLFDKIDSVDKLREQQIAKALPWEFSL